MVAAVAGIGIAGKTRIAAYCIGETFKLGQQTVLARGAGCEALGAAEVVSFAVDGLAGLAGCVGCAGGTCL